MKHRHTRRATARRQRPPHPALAALPPAGLSPTGTLRRRASRGLLAAVSLLCGFAAFGAALFAHPMLGHTAITAPLGARRSQPAHASTAVASDRAAARRMSGTAAAHVAWAEGRPPVVRAGREVALILRVTAATGHLRSVPVHVRMVDVLRPTGDLPELAHPLGGGLYRVTESFPAGGPWFALVRLGTGSASQVEALPLTVVAGPGVPWDLVLPGSLAAALTAGALLWFISRTPGPGPAGTRS